MNRPTAHDPALREPDVEAALRGLRAPAPPALAETTLISVGLADAFAPLETPLGTVFVAWNGLGVSSIDLAEGADPDPALTFGRRLEARTGRPARAVAAIPESLRRAIERRSAGDRRARVRLDWRGRAPFEQAVWSATLDIPRGEVRPYAWVAARIGHPKAVRAVGSALGRNPIPLIVPCHRVVRTDGTIGEYGLGGPANKRTLLASEGVDVARLARLGSAGIRFIGSDTTGVFCLPTCHHATRIQSRHRVPFRSVQEAARAGYRPCRSCRPAATAA